jgi:hypothetical protein
LQTAKPLRWRTSNGFAAMQFLERTPTMKKRTFIAASTTLFGALFGTLCSTRAYAVDITNAEAVSGLKTAISRGAEFAVTELSKPDGFLGNQKVRIELPQSLKSAEGIARQFGMGKQVDDLINAMNHSAESAVVEAKPLLLNAVKNMSVTDAKDILSGGQDSATQYFRRATSADLTAKFLPIVKRETAKVQLAQKYNDVAGQAAKFGLVDSKDANLDSYVTGKALDGLFLMIAEQEKQIRADPVGTGSSLLKKVFGSLGM